MSAWTHALCYDCWNVENPDRPVEKNPNNLGPGDEEQCCFCGWPTRSGIYYRAEPGMYVNCRHSE